MAQYEELDKLFLDSKFDDVIEKLSTGKNEDNAEALWRLARALYQKSKSVVKDSEVKELVTEAHQHIQRALTLSPDNFDCNKWASIILSRISELEGTKEQLKTSPKVKELMERAVSLDSTDPTCYHVLGMWCFKLADLTWIQRKAAQAIFSKPPEATYQEALDFFLKGEETKPGWFNANTLMIGKTYERLKNKEKAVEYLTKCRDAATKWEDDKQAQKEAVELLKSLGVKS